MHKSIQELRDENLFPNGSAVVIGGSGGIGKEVCRSFAAEGVPIIFTYNKNRKNAEELESEINNAGIDVKSANLSLNDKDAVDSFFTSLSDSKEKIHTIVNATGADIKMKWINSLSYEDWASVMRNDADGFFNLIKSSLPLMQENGGSYIAITSIGLSRWPTKDVLSVAPKAAIDALISGIAKEEGRNGVRANSIQLGIIEAGIFLRIKDTEYTPEYVEAAKRNTALKRLGSAQDVANAVIFLASNKASYITGQCLYLDGGYRI
tara:strand:- start:1509 stop:2300 length:792 start_codon:yes stop_codon:yes gene_type:complete